MEKFRVHFIGSGYESVKWVEVNAPTARQAMIMAEELYKVSEWKFRYMDMYAEFAPY